MFSVQYVFTKTVLSYKKKNDQHRPLARLLFIFAAFKA